MFRPLFRLTLAAMACLALNFLAGCASAPVVYHDGETEEGLATWYGREQQGGHTASGQRFNMYLLTAAHRHLPFGAMVRVTNQLNELSVVVRINDRGPFGDDDRIIDLSSAAADVIKMKRAGVVPVDLEVLSLPPKKHHKTE